MEKYLLKRLLIATYCFLLVIGNLFGQKKKSKVSDSLVYVVSPVSFNSLYSDFSPVYYKNGLAFTSNRINYLGVKHTGEKGQPLTDIFFVEGKTGEKWKTAKGLGTSINTIFNEGPCTFNSEGSMMFFNRNYEEKRYQSKMKILSAELVDGEWGKVKSLPFNKNSYSCMHPTLSVSGKELYFASDMPGGMGGMDLYVSFLKDTIWSEPVNLGPNINTKGNEVFPVVQKDGTLYFSTDGYSVAGDLDLFYTKKSEKIWAHPTNPGSPFNSEKDDFGLIMDSTLTSGFFASNRQGKEDDIFSFKLNQPAYKDCPPLKINNYCVTFFEENTLIDDTIPYRYEWEIEGEVIKGKKVKYCFNGPGSYEVKLNVVDTVLKTILSGEVYTLDLNDEVQPFISSPDTAFTGKEIKFNGIKSHIPLCGNKKYYWSFGDGTHKNGESVGHTYLQPGKYIVQLGVNGVNSEPDSKEEMCSKCVYKTVVIVSGK